MPCSENPPVLDYMNDRSCKIAEIYFCHALLVAVILIGTACGGQLYRVKPLSGPPVDSPTTASLLDLGIEARGLDGDRSLEHFEGNLPMAGVLAVEVHLTNRSTSPLSLGSLNFALFERDGRPCHELTPDRALRRVMKFYGNRIYQIEAHRETVEGYRRIALPRGGELGAGEVRCGVIFYAIPAQAPLDAGFSLQVNLADESTRLAITTRDRGER